MTRKPPSLADAYAIRTPEDNKRVYANWADTYDVGFAEKMDYHLPNQVAQAFANSGGSGPILDVGAGTGLAGQAASDLGLGPIDATDISPEMLVISDSKSIYRRIFVGDLNKQLPVEDNAYRGIICSGTFTTGHVGPGALDEVIRIIAPGALVVMTINPLHYQDQGFSDKFTALTAQIRDLTRTEIPGYGPNALAQYRDAKNQIVQFYKK